MRSDLPDAKILIHQMVVPSRRREMVRIDHARGASVPLPDAVRAIVEAR